MTCKDCPHFDVCKMYGALPTKKRIGSKWKNCPFRNDKSKYIELPCKVGEELFLTDYPMYHHRLKEYKFIGERVVMVIECFEFQRTCKRFVDEHFGITVFTDKSKAEEKLMELSRND